GIGNAAHRRPLAVCFLLPYRRLSRLSLHRYQYCRRPEPVGLRTRKAREDGAGMEGMMHGGSADREARQWLQRFEAALASPETAEWNDLFASECWWRDLVALTWNIVTLEGADSIAAMARHQAPLIGARDFALAPLPTSDPSEFW